MKRGMIVVSLLAFVCAGTVLAEEAAAPAAPAAPEAVAPAAPAATEAVAPAAPAAAAPACCAKDAAAKASKCYVCEKCKAVATAAGKCAACNQDLKCMCVLSIKDGVAMCCACGGECKCCAKAEDATKCVCGKDLVKVSLKGKSVCEKDLVISDKAGKCPKCEGDLKTVE